MKYELILKKRVFTFALLAILVFSTISCVEIEEDEIDPFEREKDPEIDLVDKTMNQITLEDLIELPGVKDIYKIFSIAHLASNIFFDFCWLGKQLVLHDNFLAMYIRQYGVTIPMLRKSLDTKEQLKRIYPTSEKPRIELYTHRAWFSSPWDPKEIFDYLPN